MIGSLGKHFMKFGLHLALEPNPKSWEKPKTIRRAVTLATSVMTLTKK